MMSGAKDSTCGCDVVLDCVSKEIKGVEVLSDVTLEVRAGSTIGLIGPNGSGKTMLMRVIAGLVRPTSGIVLIDGKRLWADISFPPSMGMLLENPAFLPSRSGLDNLWLLASIKGLKTRNDCAQAMRGMGLDPADRRPFRKYSLGMKQRLGIAAAVMESPELLLLDEPTNALDSSGVTMAGMAIERAHERGATIVLASHDMSFVKGLSDVVIRIAEGHLEDCALPENGLFRTCGDGGPAWTAE